MRRGVRLLAALLCCALCLAGCGGGVKTETLHRYEAVFYDAFDAAITLTAYCADEADFEALLDTVKTEYIRYHRLYDIYFSYSGVSNIKSINDSAGVAPVAVPQDVIELIEFAREAYELSDGRVNVALGSVLSIWHDIRDYNNVPNVEKKLPEEAALKAAAEHCNIDDIIVDKAAGTVYLADSEMSLDVGAVAKGYATERIAQMLEAQGYTGISINAGGNVRTIGTKPDGVKWQVAITNPDTASSKAYVDTVAVESAAVVTSGVYQRFFEYGGRRWHHIIDPDTLMPEERYLSVTVVSASSAEADALSTALFNMDYAESSALVERLEGVEALWVLADGTLLYSSGFHG